MKMVQARIEAQEQMKYQQQHQMNWSPGIQPQVLANQWQFNSGFTPDVEVCDRNLGGPPSNIYPPPEKIGNLQVPAFTTKVNYCDVPLKKTDTNE